MKRFLFIALLVVLTVFPPSTAFLKTDATASDLIPLTPHEFRVLVVGAGSSYSGYGYLISDLARYGFNVTVLHGGPTEIDYLTDNKSRFLSQYHVVILQGSQYPFPPTKVTLEELRHFTNYGGVLVNIGDALLWDETNNRWFANTTWKDSELSLWEKRFGLTVLNGSDVRSSDHPVSLDPLIYTGHWNGILHKASDLISELPTSVSYEVYTTALYHHNTRLDGAVGIYDFHFSYNNWPGITYYENATGAVGIFMNIAWVVASEGGGSFEYNYGGIRNIDERSRILGRILAHALDRDFETIIKPQPLATLRLDGVGQYYTQNYLNTSLSNFYDVVSQYNATPSVAFTDFLQFPGHQAIDYWTTTASSVLPQLKGQYSNWEYSSSLRYYTDPRLMSQDELEALLDNIKGNYTRLGIDLFSTVVAPSGNWNQSLLNAMFTRELYLLDVRKYYEDWWNLRVNSSIIVHGGAYMGLGLNYENFTQINTEANVARNQLNFEYLRYRPEWMLAVVNGFPCFVYTVSNFRWDEIGTYSLQTVCESLTSEIPDIRFVPLMEAGLYYGNKWVHIHNVNRVGSVIEFDVDASAISSVVGIGKGMLWFQVSSNESIQEVLIDNNSWSYFDDSSIRMPTPTNLSHVKVTLGASPSPRVETSRYKVVIARYDGYRLNVSISCSKNLNVSVDLFLPRVGIFETGNWSLFSPETQLTYVFSTQSRVLEYWAISDGFVTLEVGVFFLIHSTPPWYDSNVNITVDTSIMQHSVQKVVLSYSFDALWSNATLSLEDGLYVGEIPKMPYGTFVEYKIFVLDEFGYWLVTGYMSYMVGDWAPPEIGEVTWFPQSPNVGEPVSVEVYVFEPENASGLDYVQLRHYLDDVTGIANASRVNMTQEEGYWVADIPDSTHITSDDLVNFYVQAYDKAGNMRETPHYSYRVVGGFALPFEILVVLLGAGLAAGIGIGFYFLRARRARRKAREDKKIRASE